MKRLVIIATEFNRNPEGWSVLEQRGWQPVKDNSTTPSKRRLVDNNGHRTPIIDLNWEEYEYDD